MAAARIYPRAQSSRAATLTSMAAWSMLSLLPDADVLGFRFGIRYADAWGHRGASHSIAFALCVAIIVGLCAPLVRRNIWRTMLLAALVIGSHAILDTFTDGGLGCALGWPFTDHRYFAAWRPIPVAPIGRRFFSDAGLTVALDELLLFSPLFLYALWPRRTREDDAMASERTD